MSACRRNATLRNVRARSYTALLIFEEFYISATVFFRCRGRSRRRLEDGKCQVAPFAFLPGGGGGLGRRVGRRRRRDRRGLRKGRAPGPLCSRETALQSLRFARIIRHVIRRSLHRRTVDVPTRRGAATLRMSMPVPRASRIAVSISAEMRGRPSRTPRPWLAPAPARH
jgi:hypothetical protein